MIACNQAAIAQVSEKVLWSFSNGTFDGNGPSGPLVMDSAGNLYGTTANGGANLEGTAFKITPTGQESVLGVFATSDLRGWNPSAGLIKDKSGNLYGTTSFGGLYSDLNTGLGGTVFALTLSGQGSTLWDFNNGTDGANPYGGLLLDANGNLFGTTSAGGLYKGGTAFELTSAGQETILWNFGNGADGIAPSLL